MLSISFRKASKDLNDLLNFMITKRLKIDSAIAIDCGDGRTILEISKMLKINQIYGIDRNREFLSEAKERGITILNITLDEIKRKFDLVIVYNSLYNYGNIDSFIPRIKKITNKYILVIDDSAFTESPVLSLLCLLIKLP